MAAARCVPGFLWRRAPEGAAQSLCSGSAASGCSAQCGFQRDALVLKCVDGFLGFGWGAAARLAEPLHAQRGFLGRLCPKVDYGSLHPVSQPADFHKVAFLQGRTHLREQVVHFVEEALDHLPHHVLAVEAPRKRLFRIEDEGRCLGRCFCRAGRCRGKLRHGHYATSQTLDQANHLLGIDRLGKVAIHSRRQAAIPVALHRMGRHGDDRHPAAAVFALADGSRGFQAVHARHLHVHQDHVVAVLLGQVDCLLAVPRDLDKMAPILQDVGGQLLICGVVFHQQDAQLGAGRRGDSDRGLEVGREFLRQRQADGEVERASLAHFAFDPDAPAHHLHQALQMESPRPVPPKRRAMEASAWAKGWKRRSRPEGGMPIPVSRTANSRQASPSCDRA